MILQTRAFRFVGATTATRALLSSTTQTKLSGSIFLGHMASAFKTAGGQPSRLPISAKFFQQDGLDLKVATATATGQTKTVPGARPANAGAFVPALDPALEADLAKTVNGRLFTNLWLRNGGEAQTLINSSRKAATLWHRNYGPTLPSRLARSAADRQRAMPDQLQGKHVDACVRNILDIFAKYGGGELREAASIYRTSMPSLAGKSFDQIRASSEGNHG